MITFKCNECEKTEYEVGIIQEHGDSFYVYFECKSCGKKEYYTEYVEVSYE